MSVLERFLKYVKFDTASDPNSDLAPSTLKQLELGKALVAELKELEVSDAYLSDTGYVYATLPANLEGVTPIGFIAHLDTSYEVSGKDVQARVIENYDGQDINLNSEVITKVADFPFLSDLKGKTIVVTDGTTLLGADDKAGVAEIMTLVAYYQNNPQVSHGEIKICFTPDEEIGRGTVNFDFDYFKVDFAYTLDGGAVGGIEYENFNAASAVVNVKGVSIHPGSAKNKMINAINLAHEFHSLLPYQARPEYTSDYEGFIHLNDLNGGVELVTLKYIIRDHDMVNFNNLKKAMQQAQKFINEKYQADFVDLKIEDSYYNMKESLKDKMGIIELAKTAIRNVGIVPYSLPIRGGTDGAMLTYQGLPCPNLGTGGYNYHSKHEFAVVEEMEQSVQIMQEIVRLVSVGKM